MRKIVLLITVLFLSGTAFGQNDSAVFTGTVFIYGSGFNTRTVSRPFTLRLNRETPRDEATRLIRVLQESGQSELLDQLDEKKVGTFSLGSEVGRDVNAASIDEVGGRTRVRAVFARWINFGEVRGGYRSVDYPFSYIEIFVDPRTGKGEGTFIAAAQIRFKERDGQSQIEIEDFGTFPGRLMGVQMRGRIAE